jgi:hypothetical protein
VQIFLALRCFAAVNFALPSHKYFSHHGAGAELLDPLQDMPKDTHFWHQWVVPQLAI